MARADIIVLGREINQYITVKNDVYCVFFYSFPLSDYESSPPFLLTFFLMNGFEFCEMFYLTLMCMYHFYSLPVNVIGYISYFQLLHPQINCT